MSKTVDPKAGIGAKKLCMTDIPLTAFIQQAKPATDGANKYGKYNWMELPDETMSNMTYINAVIRHLLLYTAGQDVASDSGVHHLDHIRAGLNVLRDAEFLGKIKDERIKMKPEDLIRYEVLINGEDV